MLLVQTYLQTHSLKELELEHGIYARIQDHKFSLNYDQIEAKEQDKLAQQSRGLVLQHNHTNFNHDMIVGPTNILAYGFNRFFNYGQSVAANVDFNNAIFFSKEDGTNIQLYFDHIKNDWCTATRSVPEANLPVDGFAEYTFTTLFQKAIQETTGLSYSDWLLKAKLDKNNTYIFELCTPVNRIVVEYNAYSVYLIGVRNKETYQEYNISEFKDILLVPLCPTFDINNVNDMIEIVTNANPLKLEGMVVCDNKFRRVKVKNPSYVAYNRIRDSVANSPRALLQIILNEKLDDISCLLSENINSLAQTYKTNLTNLFHDFHIKYESCINELNKLGTMSDKVHRKQFALLIQNNNCWLSPAMDIYSGKSLSLRDYINNQKDVNGEYKKSILDVLIDKISD